jgi:hypothetical protein
MVSANERAAASRRYEAVTHVFVGLDNEGTTGPSDLDELRFTLLKTGESYEVKDAFSMKAEDESGKPLRAGTHLLQLLVATWYYPAVSNVEWREKWRDKGYLWSDSLVSDPMPFTVPKRPAVRDCGNL